MEWTLLWVIISSNTTTVDCCPCHHHCCHLHHHNSRHHHHHHFPLCHHIHCVHMFLPPVGCLWLLSLYSTQYMILLANTPVFLSLGQQYSVLDITSIVKRAIWPNYFSTILLWQLLSILYVDNFHCISEKKTNKHTLPIDIFYNSPGFQDKESSANSDIFIAEVWLWLSTRWTIQGNLLLSFSFHSSLPPTVTQTIL